jgi:light-regulated signal transduction histidine kinase (bacteriophytochrome)
LIINLLQSCRLNAPVRSHVPVDSMAVYQKAVANLQTALLEKGVQLSCDPLPMVSGEFTELVELFQNLIANGIKFNRSMPPRIHVSVREEAMWAVFSVRDNGIGIDREYRERIFLLFQRLHAREQYGGTGIGLTICKKIVERHGGKIWVESTPGQGSTFFFSLPRAAR